MAAAARRRRPRAACRVAAGVGPAGGGSGSFCSEPQTGVSVNGYYGGTPRGERLDRIVGRVLYTSSSEFSSDDILRRP